MNIDTTEHLRAAAEGIRAEIQKAPNSRRLTFALQAVQSAQKLWAEFAIERAAPMRAAMPFHCVRTLRSGEQRGAMCGDHDAAHIVTAQRFSGMAVAIQCPKCRAKLAGAAGEPLRYRVYEVQRADAGGRLYAPVDQYGVESGDTPSYSYEAIQQRCDELNARRGGT